MFRILVCNGKTTHFNSLCTLIYYLNAIKRWQNCHWLLGRKSVWIYAHAFGYIVAAFELLLQKDENIFVFQNVDEQ